MEHCHNTVHEDNAMLVRGDINGGGNTPTLVPLPTPIPTPTGVKFSPPEDIERDRVLGHSNRNRQSHHVPPVLAQ
jgi:hypothetical protein